MPVKLQIDGGEQYLPYAKKRLAVLQEQLLRQGLRSGTRRYKLEDAEIEVHVSIPVDVASGEPRPERAQNRIRIEGGQRATHYLYRPSEYFSSLSLALLQDGGDAVVPSGQAALAPRLRCHAKPRANRPEHLGAVLRTKSEPIIRHLAPGLPGGLTAIGSRVVAGEGEFELVHTNILSDGKVAAVYEVDAEGYAFFVTTDYERFAKEIAEPRLTYSESLSRTETDITIAFGPYSFVYQTDIPRGHAGDVSIDETFEPVFQAVAQSADEGPVTVYSVGLTRLKGTASVDDRGHADVRLTATFTVRTQRDAYALFDDSVALRRSSAPATFFDLRDLISFPQGHTVYTDEGIIDNLSSVTWDPIWGALVSISTTLSGGDSANNFTERCIRNLTF